MAHHLLSFVQKATADVEAEIRQKEASDRHKETVRTQRVGLIVEMVELLLKECYDVEKYGERPELEKTTDGFKLIRKGLFKSVVVIEGTHWMARQSWTIKAHRESVEHVHENDGGGTSTEIQRLYNQSGNETEIIGDGESEAVVRSVIWQLMLTKKYL